MGTVGPSLPMLRDVLEMVRGMQIVLGTPILVARLSGSGSQSWASAKRPFSERMLKER